MLDPRPWHSLLIMLPHAAMEILLAADHANNRFRADPHGLQTPARRSKSKLAALVPKTPPRNKSPTMRFVRQSRRVGDRPRPA